MFFLTRKALSRRTLLRGSGVALALPLLESMIPAGLYGAELPKARLACLYMAHGAIMSEWTPQQEGINFELSPILQSLAPYKDQLTIVSNLDLPAARVGPNSAGENHNRSSACWLTCTPPRQGTSSLDQLVAQHNGQGTALPSLELSLVEGPSISYLTPTTPLPMEGNPRIVFERLFGVASTAQEREARHVQATSLLDSLTGQVAGLQRQLPADDRQRIERYLNDVREIERRMELTGGSLPAGMVMPTKPVGIPDDFEDHARLMFDLIALAWQADLTRVSTMMLARELGNPLFPKSGVPEPHHACSHHSGQADKMAMYARMNTYHVKALYGYFLEKLRNTPDGDGNLLDHSLVMYGSGMSNSNNHDHDPLPILLAGGASGRLNGGQHIRMPQGTPLANLLLAMLDKLDVPAESYADSTGMVTL
jgi:hypothetical protein